MKTDPKKLEIIAYKIMREIGRLSSVDFFKAFIAASNIYENDTVGCCCHIVLDDGNIYSENIEFCATLAKEKDCKNCIEFCEIADSLSEDQLHLLYSLYNVYSA